MSFDDIIEDTTDKLLVLNILRAKDKAPLHFDEVPSIHESVTGTASVQGAWPFGPLNKSVARNTITAGAGVQLAPSFELDNLATKDFVTGMATPIDPKFVKYWLDRGLDRRLVLLLFFSAIDVTVRDQDGDGTMRHTIRIQNSPRDAIDAFYVSPPTSSAPLEPTLGARERTTCERQADFQHYLKLIDNLTSFTAQSAPQKKVILDSVPVADSDLGKVIIAVAALDPTKTSVKYDKGSKTLSLYGVSEPKTALCLSRSQASGSEAQEGQGSCVGANVSTEGSSESKDSRTPDVEVFPQFSGGNDPRVADFCDRFGRVIEQLHGPVKDKDGKLEPTVAQPSDPKPQIRMEIRSVGEIIQFLGDVMAYQEAIQAYKDSQNTKTPRFDTSRLNSILTFGFCGATTNYAAEPEPHCGDYFFNISTADNNEDSRFSVSYRHQTYFVPRYVRPDQWQSDRSTPCSEKDSKPGSDPSCIDHTLEVLAVVNQLIDLQRSAQDVQQTPYVSVLP